MVLARGKGTRLAPLAERLLAAHEEAQRMLHDAGDRLAVKIEPGTADARLRCTASHDLLLAEFIASAELNVDLGFRGSLESVSAYAHGGADVAGFHVLAGTSDSEAAASFHLLQPRRDRLVRFARREQGLMVAAGTRRRSARWRNVARKRARFVNRQRGSGTRLLIDHPEARGRIPERAPGIRGRGIHARAVGATIASGGADAGIGVRAAAAHFGLDFLPLGAETLLARRPAARARGASHAALSRGPDRPPAAAHRQSARRLQRQRRRRDRPGVGPQRGPEVSGEAAATPSATSRSVNRYDRAEWAGAFGDLGTLLPFLIAYIAVVKVDPLGMLLAFGASMIAVGLYYRTPIPVQPMKAIGAVAATQASQNLVVTPQAVYASGVASGLIWLVLGLTGLAEKIARLSRARSPWASSSAWASASCSRD